MRCLLFLFVALACSIQLDARLKQAPQVRHPGPPLPKGIAITGKYSVSWDVERQVTRYTGKLRVEQGKTVLESVDNKAWVEVGPRGKLRTSKGKWRTFAAPPKKIHPGK